MCVCAGEAYEPPSKKKSKERDDADYEIDIEEASEEEDDEEYTIDVQKAKDEDDDDEDDDTDRLLAEKQKSEGFQSNVRGSFVLDSSAQVCFASLHRI